MKSKATKRAEAEVRQEEYAALDAWGKSQRIAGRRGESKKERARYELMEAWEVEILSLPLRAAY